MNLSFLKSFQNVLQDKLFVCSFRKKIVQDIEGQSLFFYMHECISLFNEWLYYMAWRPYIIKYQLYLIPVYKKKSNKAIFLLHLLF